MVNSCLSGTGWSKWLPVSLRLTTGSLNLQAGAFTPFTMTMSREDGYQNLDAIQLKMPPRMLVKELAFDSTGSYTAPPKASAKSLPTRPNRSQNFWPVWRNVCLGQNIKPDVTFKCALSGEINQEGCPKRKCGLNGVERLRLGKKPRTSRSIPAICWSL